MYRLLLTNDAVELLDVVADASLFVLQSIGPIFGKQKIQQDLKIRLNIGLTFDGLLQLLTLERFDEQIHLAADLPLLAFRQSLPQQRRASRIVARVVLGHLQQHRLKLPIAICELTLLKS